MAGRIRRATAPMTPGWARVTCSSACRGAGCPCAVSCTGVTMTSAVVPRTRVRVSFRKPFITETTTMSAPTATAMAAMPR
jgi:hypothetical protein